MTSLSSCYFCGAALDDRLRAYGFDRGLDEPDPEGGRSVVLCPGCREKLDRVLEAAGESVGLVALGDPSSPADTPSDTPADATDESESTAPTEGLLSLSEADAADPEETDRPGEDGTATPEGDEEADEPADGDTDDETSDEAATPDATDDGLTSDQSSISQSTYRQVLRLLQNREFPVERAEIETVAASAYGLSEPEVRAVLELAIERGVLEADGGRLRRPD